MIRVVIAEDHTLIREALTRMLVASRRIEVVGEAATGTEAIGLVERTRPDVLLMDVTMPEKDGLPRWRTSPPSTPPRAPSSSPCTRTRPTASAPSAPAPPAT